MLATPAFCSCHISINDDDDDPAVKVSECAVVPEGVSSETISGEAHYHSPTTDISALVPNYFQSVLWLHAGTFA